MEEEQKINIDGTEYGTDNFTEQQKYFHAQINALSEKQHMLRFDLDQLEAGKIFFIEKLKESFANVPPDSNDSEAE